MSGLHPLSFAGSTREPRRVAGDPGSPGHGPVTTEKGEWRPARQTSPRCGARTRKGTPCRAPAVKHKRRCRLHGGAQGSGAQPGNTNALKHGFYSAAAEADRRRIRALIRAWRKGVAGLG